MPELLLFTIRHGARSREWIIEPNAIFPFPLRFHDETSPLNGATGLIGALSHCIWAAANKPAILIIETQYRSPELHYKGSNAPDLHLAG